MDSRDYRDRAPVGWPGRVSRKENLATEGHRYDSVNTPASYGIAVAITNDGDLIELSVGAEPEEIFGFNVTPEFSHRTQVPIGGTMGDVMKQGYMTVKVVSGNVIANGTVHIRVDSATVDHPLGEVLAEEIVGDTVEAPNARFVGPSTPAADGSCVAEIAVKL